MNMLRKTPKPYEPGLLVRGRRAVLVGVALFSVVGHAALGYFVWDKAIAEQSVIDTDQPRTFRVRRVPAEDYQITSPLDASGEPTTPTDELIDQAVKADAALLDSERAAPQATTRSIRELGHVADSGDGVELGGFDPGDDLFGDFDPGAALADVEFADDTGGGTGGNGDAPSEGGTGSGVTSVKDAASEALDAFKAPENRNAQGTTSLAGEPAVGSTDKLTDAPPKTDVTFSIDGDDAILDDALADLIEIQVPDAPDNLDDDFTYSVATYKAAGEPGYLRLDITPEDSLRKLETMPKDVIFIVDTSRSISSTWVREVTKGVNASMGSLNKGDRFNVVLFNEKVSLLSDAGPIDADQDGFLRASRFLNKASSIGYTDLNAAMRGLLIRDIDPKRVYNLVLISDGRSTRGVNDTRDLINLITRDNDRVASIYCVGVGRRQNREMLDFLAYRNKGFVEYAEDSDDASLAIQKLMTRIRYPIIKDMRLDVVGIDKDTLFPADLPDVHQGETIRVYARYANAGPFAVRVIGRSSGKNIEFTYGSNLAQANRGGKTIARQWAFWKIHDLYSLVIREGEKPALMRQIEAIAKKYDIQSLY